MLCLWALLAQVFILRAEECIRDYHILESELVENELNLDSLTRSFFPPNTPSVPVVEVFYTISNVSGPDQHPLILELEGGHDETELALLAKYRYRWSKTPIYLFMDPIILEKLALFTVRINSIPARLVIRQNLCDNYTISGIPLPQYYLNQMTSLLKTYALKRDRGLDTDILNLQGYASYFNDSDFRVIGFDTNYRENLFLLIFGLIALAAFITIATPLLINAQYESLYRLAIDQHTNMIFLIWATVIICFMATISILVTDVYFLFIERLMMDNVPARWIYYFAMVLIVIFLFLDLLLVCMVKKEKDFPLPYVLQFIFCQHCCQNTIFAQTLAIWFAIMFMQLGSFHLTFIFWAFVASPVQTGSTLLLFITGIVSGISLTTLFLAVFQKRKSPVSTATQRKSIARVYLLKSLYLILFILVLAFTIFFATCFIRITIYVGDVQSGGIPSLITSLAPSALLAGMGFLGKRVLEKYVPRDTVKKDSEEAEKSVASDPVVSSVQTEDQSCSTSDSGNTHTESQQGDRKEDKRTYYEHSV